jgi:hypothetical protein
MSVSLAACGLLVMVFTRAKHPGWLGFALGAGLCGAALA